MARPIPFSTQPKALQKRTLAILGRAETVGDSWTGTCAVYRDRRDEGAVPRGRQAGGGHLMVPGSPPKARPPVTSTLRGPRLC